MESRHPMPFGAEITGEGVRFALWAPSAKTVDLAVGSRRHRMPHAGQGWFSLVDARTEAGERYGYAIDGADDLVPDPASRFQDDDLDRRSTIQDPASYAWTDDSWSGRNWNEVVLYEAHLGTATAGGGYASFAEKLEHIRDAGFTAVELMPLAETSGLRTWGYDGVLPFAPNNAYGQPDDLKRFVDKAHGLGLMVFLDVVYNHFGPCGNFLHGYAKSFFTEKHHTPWGAAINFDGDNDGSEVVREFFIQNALYWLREFHIDGLRFDAVHAIIDDSDRHFLDELAQRIRETFPGRHIHLVLENEKNEASRLTRDGDGRALTYDAQWDDDIHHCWHVLLTGEAEGYYGDFAGDTVARLGRCLAEGFAYQGEFSPNLEHERGEPTEGLPPQAFVAFLQNHDQIGNRANGERLTTLSDPDKLRLARTTLYLSPQIPMVFMGDEWGTKTPFQFFVNFEQDPDLEAAVRKGRQKEFERFTSFSGEVPDPTSLATFERSSLDWTETDEDPYAAILRETRELLALRQTEIVPLMANAFGGSSYERIGAGGLLVEWTFERGVLTFVLNFDAAVLKHTPADNARLLWNHGAEHEGKSFNLGPWSGVVLKSVSA